MDPDFENTETYNWCVLADKKYNAIIKNCHNAVKREPIKLQDWKFKWTNLTKLGN